MLGSVVQVHLSPPDTTSRRFARIGGFLVYGTAFVHAAAFCSRDDDRRVGRAALGTLCPRGSLHRVIPDFNRADAIRWRFQMIIRIRFDGIGASDETLLPMLIVPRGHSVPTLVS